MRGFAPATRVMSRSEPPAAASGSCPSTRTAPAWFRIRLASACGRWLVSAISRSCAAGSIATGTAPERRDEAVQHPVALRLGLRDRCQEPRRSLEELRAPVRGAAGLGAADRMPADVAHPVADGRAETRLRGADVGHRAARAGGVEHGRDLVRRAPPRAWRRAPARPPPTAATRLSAGSSTAPRSAASARNSGSASQAVTRRTPARFAASPTDEPIRPVPTIARRSTNLLAHERDERADLVGEGAELGGRNELRPVAERLVRSRVRPRR